jgi:propanol-preferring alcohol dehydrogenase
MKDTYKAVEVSEPGVLRVVERQVSQPGEGQVRIRVEACGICHTDAATVMGIYPGLTLPRVPGHEVIGRIEALGAGVSRWKSVNGLVSASSLAKTVCANRADAETL